MDARAQALSAGRIDDFLRPLVGDARDKEALIARGFVSAPVESPSFLLQVSSIRGQVLPVEVTTRFRYRYEGLPPDNPFSFPIAYRIDADEEMLKITQSLPGPDQLPMWATGEVEQLRTTHFLGMSRPGASGVGDLLAVAEAARMDLVNELPQSLDDVALVVLANDDDEFDRLISLTDETPGGRVAQVSTLLEVTPTTVQVQGRHIVVNLAQLNRDRTGPETLRHELAHLALAPVTRPTTPAWVAEGAAMFLAKTTPTAAWSAGIRTGEFDRIQIERLSESAFLGTDHASAVSASAEYAYAAAVVWYLVDSFGRDRFWRFYRSFTEVPAEELYKAMPRGMADEGSELAGLRSSATLNALQSEYDLVPTDLDVRVRDWLAQTAW